MHPALSSRLAQHAREALDKIHEATYAVWAAHNIDFRDLVWKHYLSQEEPLLENVHLLLTNPPYNMHCIRKDDNSGHNLLGANYFVDAGRFGKAVVKPGSHNHIFFSTL